MLSDVLLSTKGGLHITSYKNFEICPPVIVWDDRKSVGSDFEGIQIGLAKSRDFTSEIGL